MFPFGLVVPLHWLGCLERGEVYCEILGVIYLLLCYDLFVIKQAFSG